MKKVKGFTLIEWLMVIVLISIIGITAGPLFVHHQTFQERFFLDEMQELLRYGRKIALTSGCEVQVAYKSDNEIALFQRQSCEQEPFSRIVPSPYIIDEPGYIAKIPKSVSFRLSLPIYIDATGKVFDQNHRFLKKVELKIKTQQVSMDGVTGFVYEEKTK